MKFSLVAALAILTAAASAAPIQLKCDLAKHRFSPLLTHFCKLNCEKCISEKQNCEYLTKQCDFPRAVDMRALAEEIDI
ncbi:hypothetical protein TWF696_000228 [Orbilia brochopaga]|uniref:Uncharacterized protein n=1 Tax=Orbilia brochopaga TaxID=3140254 RepID=A0AAV9VD03_9PEZI